MYKVVGGPRSRAFRVLWMLEELGQQYDHMAVSARSDEVLALNPTGKIPVLLVDDTVLTDSTAILQFLADRHNALTFPAGSLERARQDGLTQFVLDELDALLWTAARHSFVLPVEHRVPQVKASLQWEFKRSIIRLSDKLGDGPFLMGDTLTVPDLIATHCCGWAITAKFPMENARINDWMARMRARPAYQAVSRA